MMSVTITMIIPVYNTAAYLDKCLSSISAQSFSDFELIIVDDGSTDDSPKICDDWAKKDSRFTVIHQKNAGQSAARNAGIDAAKGDYLAFADSDDYVEPEYLQRLYDTIQKFKADLSLCGYYEHKNRVKRALGPEKECVLDRNTALGKLVEDKELKSFFWASLFKKELFEGIRLPVGRNYEDLAVIYKLYYKADNVAMTPEPLYHYQIRVGSMSYNDATAGVWHEKCHASVESQTERTAFFRDKKESELAGHSLAESLPYIYSDILTGYQTDNIEDVAESRAYLKKEKKEIMANPYISRKNKLLYNIYSANRFVFTLFFRGKVKKEK